ncbi:hypothetical protein UA08_05688 [Talaromyces atroroseus]|uniref:HNH nuclease domain-containing protein n=1 Tax=Talaromyces atroroseus TaxID=1441469 RepID=A0A225ATD5_TALAT|nr:hypothetical protein UA08_05688 [Talaromyces atroroseus]OKL58859.1 hypothetical protein UA08_05688 [Talaromyces atroroseus]
MSNGHVAGFPSCSFLVQLSFFSPISLGLHSFLLDYFQLELYSPSSKGNLILVFKFEPQLPYLTQGCCTIISSRFEPMPPSDIGNGCFNERSDVRTEVLYRIEAGIKDKTGSDMVPPEFWAFCQVADVSKLNALIATVEPLEPAVATGILEPNINRCHEVISRWLQNVDVKSSAPSTNYSQRSNTAISNCKKRENYKCVLTGQSESDAAHIYPFCLIKASTREPTVVATFWNTMKLFWEDDRVKQWPKDIFGNELDLRNPQDTCLNMLSLSQYPHTLWGSGRFALRPIEKPNSTTLKVQFYWQKNSSDGVTEIRLLTAPESTRGLYGEPDHLPTLTGTYKDNGEPEYKAIASGDIFTLTTPDPDQLPLPSWPLLEMQWHLQRIAAMSGAAEAQYYLDSDDDSDIKDVINFDTTVGHVKDILMWLQTSTDNSESPAEWGIPTIAN